MYAGGLPPPPPAPPRLPRRRRWSPLLAVTALTAVAAAGVAALVWDGEIFGNDSDDPREGSVDATEYAGWDPRVVDLVAFVEEERGLRFHEPVQIDFLTEDEFRRELEIGEDDVTDDELAEIQETLPLLRALGFVAGDLDVLSAVQEYTQAATLAFYDDDEERIVVPTTELTLTDEVTLVHELTHALQDQHFDLGALLDDEEDGGEDIQRATEGLALVEGDASRIESAYLDSLPLPELQDYIDAYSSAADGARSVLENLPSSLVAMMQTDYVLGEPFVATLASEGGNAAVDQAFETSPPLGRHLVDPRTYLESDREAELGDVRPPSPPAGVGEPLDQGELGALDVYFILAERIDVLDALAMADTWEQGSYVTYETQTQMCLTAAVGGSEPDSLRAAFHEWAIANPPQARARVSDGPGDDLLVEVCDPGPAAELPHDRAMEALALLSTRSRTAWELTAYLGLDIDRAWEVADCTAGDLHRSGALDPGTTGLEADPEEQSNQIREALGICWR